MSMFLTVLLWVLAYNFVGYMFSLLFRTCCDDFVRDVTETPSLIMIPILLWPLLLIGLIILATNELLKKIRAKEFFQRFIRMVLFIKQPATERKRNFVNENM